MPKLFRKAAIAAKIESTPGTDSVPTAATNAMLVRNFTWSPLEMTVEDRDFVRAYLGNSENIVVAQWGMAEFEVEIAGAGAAGTAPKYGPLLRGCGLAETITGGVSAAYAPVSSGFETLTLYCNLDQLLHKATYCMGSVRLTLDASKIPVYHFSFKGLYKPVTDTSDWTPSYTGFVKPLGVTKLNTTLSLHGLSTAVVEQLTLDLKNQVEYRNLINAESVHITDRKPDGSIALEMTTVAAKDWMTSIGAAGTGVLNVVQGTVAGNIVEINCPTAQLTQPRYTDSQGIAMLSANLRLVPGSSGNDEVVITVR